MGRIIVSEFVSLDGVMEDPGGGEGTSFGGWSFRFPAPDAELYKLEELAATEAGFLGRVTYEGFASAWPAMEETTGEFGVKINAMPKVVYSSTLTDPTWRNTTVVTGDLKDVVTDLTNTYAGDVVVSGSATLATGLAELGLVDEYRLLVHPVVLGQGRRLFGDGLPVTDLTLVESRPMGSGIQLLVYRPAAKP